MNCFGIKKLSRIGLFILFLLPYMWTKIIAEDNVNGCNFNNSRFPNEISYTCAGSSGTYILKLTASNNLEISCPRYNITNTTYLDKFRGIRLPSQVERLTFIHCPFPDKQFKNILQTLNIESVAEIEWQSFKNIGNDFASINIKKISSDKLFFGNPIFQKILKISISNTIFHSTKLLENLFSNCHNLRSISLRNNSLTELPGSIFSNNEKLEELDISDNLLNNLEPTLFHSLKNLKTLRLAGNRLTYISESIFANLASLTELDASRNQLKDFHINAFKELKNIVSIDLSHNELTLENNLQSGASPFLYCGKLEKLNLKNNLISLTRMFHNRTSSLHELKMLDLSYNKLTILTIEDFIFSSSSDVVTTDLSNNQISSISTGDLQFYIDSEYSATNVFIMKDNPVVFQCCNSNENQIDADKRTIIKFDQVKCQRFEYKTAHLKDHYRERSYVMPRSFDEEINLPTYIPKNCSGAYDAIENSMTWNCVASGNEKKLITTPDSTSFHFKSCDELFDGKLIFLTALMFFLIFFMIAFLLYCKYEIEVKVWIIMHNLWPRLFTKEETPDKRYDHVSINFADGDRAFVLNYLLPLLERNGLQNKVYIRNEFLPDLTTISKEPKKVYWDDMGIKCKNYDINEKVRDGILNSIENSRQTIVVLTPNYVESPWAMIEFHTAHHKILREGRRGILIILLKEIQTDKLSFELRPYIKTNCFLKWSDPSFMKKLNRMLPRIEDHSNDQPKLNLVAEVEKLNNQ